MHAAKELLRVAFREGLIVSNNKGNRVFGSALQAWRFVDEVGERWVRFTHRDGTNGGAAYLMVDGPGTCEADETIVDHTVGREGQPRLWVEIAADNIIQMEFAQ